METFVRVVETGSFSGSGPATEFVSPEADGSEVE
jgi:hypothetical protein